MIPSRLRLIAGATLAILVGCASGIEHLSGPEGPGGRYRIKCTGGEDDCLKKALDTCPKNYKVISGDDGAPTTTCTPSVGEPGRYSSGTNRTRCEGEFVVECLR